MKALSHMILPAVLAVAVPAASLAAGPSAPDAADPARVEYAIKAAYLYNFIRYVEWPTNAQPAAGEPLVIGILGNDPFAGALDEIVARKRTAQGHELKIKRAGQARDLTDCHVVFMAESEANAALEFPDGLRGRAILTVGEAVDFLEKGGVLRFRIVGKKVRFEIRDASISPTGLKISSQLRKLSAGGLSGADQETDNP